MSTTVGMLLLIGPMLASVIFVASAWNHVANRGKISAAARVAKFPIPWLAGRTAGVWLAITRRALVWG
jgi:hypothetical protein